MADRRELLDLATRVAGWANEGEQVEAFAVRSSSTSVAVYNAEVETFESASTEGLGIRVVVGDRQGLSYATVLDETTMKETLEQARDNAAFATSDAHVGLAVPDGLAAVQHDLWRDDLASVPTSRKIELALELEREVLAGDARIRAVPRSGFGDTQHELALATSTGVAVWSRRTRASMSTNCLAGDAGETQTGFGYTVSRGFAGLDLHKAARDAVRRAVRMLGAVKPPSARVVVLLDPTVTSSFLGILAGTLSGDAVLKGRSLFAHRLGEEVAAPAVTLVDDPTNPLAYGADAYDDEGLAARRNVLIGRGMLHRFLYDTYTGRRAGLASTGSAVRPSLGSAPTPGAMALSLEPGDRDQDSLVASIDDGILVQSVSGLHSGVNPVSGDFSVGAEGIRIRRGQLAEPVREVTIASTIQRMLKDTIAVGNDVEWLPSSAAGVSLVIGDVTLSGR